MTLPPGGSDAVAAGEGVFERVEPATCLQVQKTLSGPESPTLPGGECYTFTAKIAFGVRAEIESSMAWMTSSNS
jgi:hypothetical protein